MSGRQGPGRVPERCEGHVLMADACGGSFWGDESVQTLNRNDGCTTLGLD